MATSSTGNGARHTKVRRQSIQNMVTSVNTMVSKSATIGIKPSLKISLMLSMSLMVRVVSVPIGVVSNWRRLRLSTFLYTVTRKSFTTRWPSADVLNEKRNRITVSNNSKPNCSMVISTKNRAISLWLMVSNHWLSQAGILAVRPLIPLSTAY